MSAVSAAGDRRLWLTFGWLSIGYVVLTFVGAIFQPQETLGAKQSDVISALVTSSMSSVFIGGYIEFIASLVFLVLALLLAQLLRGTGETCRWLATCIAGLAVVYVAVMVGSGLAAGAAAVYDGHHGAPLATVSAVQDIRNIGYALAGGVAGALVLATSAAARLARALPAWLTVAGGVVGIVCIAAVPAARQGAPQTMLWFLWLLVIGIVAVRQGRRVGPTPQASVAPAA